MLPCVANDMNRWEIFPSLLICTGIYIFFLYKFLTTQRSMRENAFYMVFQERWVSPTRHQILLSQLRGSGQDTVSLWKKTPFLLENHVKCISNPGLVDLCFRPVDSIFTRR